MLKRRADVWSRMQGLDVESGRASVNDRLRYCQAFSQESPLPWRVTKGASVLFVIQLFVAVLLMQRYVTEGITATGTKG